MHAAQVALILLAAIMDNEEEFAYDMRVFCPSHDDGCDVLRPSDVSTLVAGLKGRRLRVVNYVSSDVAVDETMYTARQSRARPSARGPFLCKKTHTPHVRPLVCNVRLHGTLGRRKRNYRKSTLQA